MNNPMPRFAIFNSFGQHIDYVHAVSLRQAIQRANARYDFRVHVEMALNTRPARNDRQNANLAYQAKRAPYPVGDFEARRAALIAAHKAGA